MRIDGHNWGCSTEGSGIGGRVTQSDRVDTDDRLWTVRNNAINLVEAEVNPWGN